jgi:hypothetical protein
MFPGETTLDRMQVVKGACDFPVGLFDIKRTELAQRWLRAHRDDFEPAVRNDLASEEMKLVCRCFDVVLHEVLFSPALQCFDHVRKTWVQLCLRRL